MTATVHQLAVSHGGVPKLAVREVLVHELGLAGDKQKHTKIHGGPERAVCVYSLERIGQLQAEGHAITPGSAGENITITGLAWASLGAAQRIAFGDEVILVLTWPTAPCKQIAGSFVDRKFRRIDVKQHPGWSRWYASVERGGLVRTGDAVTLL